MGDGVTDAKQPNTLDLTGYGREWCRGALPHNNSYAPAEALAARNALFIFSTGYSGSAIVDGFGDQLVLRKPFLEKELAAQA